MPITKSSSSGRSSPSDSLSSKNSEHSHLSARQIKKKQARQKLILKENQQSNISAVRKILKKIDTEPDKKLTSIEKTILEANHNYVSGLKERKSRRLSAEATKKSKFNELIDSDEKLDQAALETAKLLVSCKKSGKTVIVYTGAGMSTSANIRDYRGPNGIWTEIEQKKSTKTPQNLNNFISTTNSLTQAKPTIGHMVLKNMIDRNYINHILSQNCDGLHIRSGISYQNLSEIHGNMYAERCNSGSKTCSVASPIYRIFDVTEKTSFRRHFTGRKCPNCKENDHSARSTRSKQLDNRLNDTIVHFGEFSPETSRYPYNWQGAYKTIYPWWDGSNSQFINKVVNHNDEVKNHRKKLGAIICLGTSLAVLKSYKHLWPSDLENLIICNLQWTCKDSSAKIKVHAKTDLFLEKVHEKLSEIEEIFTEKNEVPKYSIENDQLLKLAVPVPAEEMKTINTLSILPYKTKTSSQITSSILDPFQSIMEHIDSLENPKIQPAWYGIGHKRKRPCK